MTKEIWFKLIEKFIWYKRELDLLNIQIKKSKLDSKLIRSSNFPSEVSENLVAFCYEILYNKQLKWIAGADLWNDEERYEVKCSVLGPISFSSKLNFENLFLLEAVDLTCLEKLTFKLYHIKDKAFVFKKLKVNKKKTFLDFELSGKRPRCSLDFLLKEFRKKKLNVDYYYVSVNVKKKKIKITKLLLPL